jgi:hypothetical protein
MTGGPHPDLVAELVRLRGAELLARAESSRAAALVANERRSRVGPRLARLLRRRRLPAPAEGVLLELRIRYAGASDDTALRRLAALDSSTVPQPPLLVAEVGSELQAALSLWDGRVIADPFRKTEALVELLTLRAAHIHSAAAALLKVRRAAERAPAADPSKQTP